MSTLLPKISVVMPFYNAANFLDEAIQSILNQTFTDFEFIIINDASTDNSDDVVKKYLNDGRIIYICNEQNVGIVQNLNKGLGLAKSEIIARMDGDDIAEKTRFQEQFDYILNHNHIAVVGSFIKIIDENSNQIDLRTKPVDPEEISNNILTYSPVVHPSTMFRKEIIQKVGSYRQEFLLSEDVDLWYRLIFNGHKISNVPKFLLHYRYHGNSTAHRSRENAVRAYRLRKTTIKDFNLKPGPKIMILIYLQLIVGLIFSGRKRQLIEGLYKKILLYGK